MRREPGIAALDRGQSTLEGCHRISRTQSGQTATILLSPADYSRKHYVHLKKKKKHLDKLLKLTLQSQRKDLDLDLESG